MQKDQELIYELFEKVDKNFEKHLSIEKNHRILFSGIFGIGKTTFLNHFFGKSENQEKYNVFHLFPINYSVLSNEDIFKYIKYDILYEMVSEDKVSLKRSKLQLEKEIPRFALDKLPEVASLLLLLIPKMGKQYHQLAEGLRKIGSEFNSISDQKMPEESVLVNSLLNSYTKSTGELYEFNIITTLIHSTLKNLKGKGDLKKKNILIIDDLDRIDPNHVFRLFNVFSAHFDKKDEDKNKFGFDQIIFICDVQNIKGIFKHQFGSRADFKGYIDKFYSYKVYNFDNLSNIISITENFIDSIKFEPEGVRKDIFENTSKDAISYLKFILVNLIKNSEINLRTFLKVLRKGKFVLKRREAIFQKGTLDVFNLPLLLTFHILAEFFVDKEILNEALINCSNDPNPFFFDRYRYDDILAECIYIQLLAKGYEDKSLNKVDYQDSNKIHQFKIYFQKKRGNPRFKDPGIIQFHGLLGNGSLGKEMGLDLIRERVNLFEFLSNCQLKK